MIQNITRNAEGFPEVHWIEQLAGKSRMQAGAITALASGAMSGVMLIVGIIIYDLFKHGFSKLPVSSIWEALFWMLITSLVMAFIFLVIYIKSHDESYIQKFGVLPTYKYVPAYATIKKDDQNNLIFFWYRKKQAQGLLLEKIKSFEFGDHSDWFANLSEQNMHYKSFVIIATSSSGIAEIAVHAGPKAQLAHLHSILTEEFITNRKNFAGSSRSPLSMQSLPVARPSSGKPQTL